MVITFDSSRRPCDSDALATSSYEMNFAQPLSDDTFVSAAVRVVLPWSICPIVPTFTCGLLRSNFSLAMSTILVCRYEHSGADVQDRTGDLVLTKDALCQLSYIGLRAFGASADKSAVTFSVACHSKLARDPRER